MHVLVKSYNDYDQHGDYFVAMFEKCPSITELQELLKIDFDEAAHIAHNGGGRRKYEYSWYICYAVEPGKSYHEEE